VSYLGGGVMATYNVHLRLIGKLTVDFILALTELFSLAATADGATSVFAPTE